MLYQVAPGTVDLEINQDDFDMEACFLTSRRVYDDVSLGANRTYVYTNELSRTEQIIFPQGGVKNDTDVRISVSAILSLSLRTLYLGNYDRVRVSFMGIDHLDSIIAALSPKSRRLPH